MPKPIAVTEDALAAHWQMTPRRVRQLADEGVAARLEAGTYDLLASDRALIAWLRKDEPTQRQKRELLRFKQLEVERKLEEKDKLWLTLNEVREVIDAAWSALHQAHAACLNHTVTAFAYVWNDQERVRKHAFELDASVKGELRGARAQLEGIYGMALQEMECEQRRGILICSRRIRALHTALGEDDAEEAADYRRRIGQRTKAKR